MGWLKDKIKEVVKEELWQDKQKTRHHPCSACGLVYDRKPNDNYSGMLTSALIITDTQLEWLYCPPCREKYKPKDSLLEWTKLNRAKVQALKDKLEGKGK